MEQAVRAFVAGAILAASLSPASAESVKLVTGNGYQPFADQSLPSGGLTTDLVRTAYERAGYEVSIQFLPWKRGAAMVRDGNADATFPYVKTDEREKVYTFSEPIFAIPISPAVSPENAGTINAFEDMKGKKTCRPVGWASASPELNEAEKAGEITVQRPSAIESCFRLLEAGRVDFLVGEEPRLQADAEKALGSRDSIHIEDFTLGETRLHLIFAKTSKETSDRVEAANKALRDLKASDVFQEIVDRHLP
jgi:polar amino acid transport system substrate-binding protein